MMHRRASAILFYDKNRVLLQDRTGISRNGEEWGFFGGGIEPGETPTEAIVREVREELEYDLREFEFFKMYRRTKGNNMVTAYVYTSDFPGFGSFNQQEGAGMRLFSVEDALGLRMFPIDHEILGDFGKYLKTREIPGSPH